jgi:hypothetical protein
MCIDYTSLNKTCPKDEYALPQICQIVDSTTSCELLSFLDAYSGYHQISMVIDDKEKSIYYSVWNILLYKDGIQPKNGGGYLSKRSYIPSWKLKLDEILKSTLMML